MTNDDQWRPIRLRMSRLGILEDDLEERFIRGTGPGGQKINKTSSCVWLKHRPTGTEVKCQRSRSQSANRLLAREELCDRFESSRAAALQERRARAARKRVQSRGRSRSTKRKMRETKTRRAQIKQNRRRPDY